MTENVQTTMLFEEKGDKIFPMVVYIVFLRYDIFYSYFFPKFPWGTYTVPQSILDYMLYIVMIFLLPVSFILFKNKPGSIKYIYFLTYTFINCINDIWLYRGNSEAYSSGNVVEIVIVLFSPIFVNKKFFYTVSLGTILKFFIVGFALQDAVVLFPLIIVIVLSLIAFILLHRFLNYLAAISDAYDQKLEGIVKGIIATLELKDQYTRGHSERVAYYAMSLAKESGKLKKEEEKPFYYACLLHDIGKSIYPIPFC